MAKHDDLGRHLDFGTQPKHTQQPPPPPVKSTGRLVTVTFFVSLIIGFIAFWNYLGISNPLLGPTQQLARLFIPAPQTLFGKDRISLLLLGIDYNYNEKDEEYSAGARSDTIMAVSLDFPSKTVHILSVPRDMDVVLPNGREDKINAAYSGGGPHESERVVAQFLGLPKFDRYITLKINATKALIDAIGGIDVPVAQRMDYDDSWGHLHIHFSPGMHHMNGEQAVSYSRFRHDACSDPCRIKRQQQVMRITIAKLKNDKFNDLTHIRQLIDVANRNVETDLTAQEKFSLANHYSSVNLATIKTEQVPYIADKVLATAGDVIIPDEYARAVLVKKLFLDPVDPIRAAPADPHGVAEVTPQNVRVAVKNGSGRRGLGSKVASQLRRHGFVVASVGNADSFNHDVTEIHVHNSKPYIGERVKRDLALPTAEIRPGSASTVTDVTLIVGKDYDNASNTVDLP